MLSSLAALGGAWDMIAGATLGLALAALIAWVGARFGTRIDLAKFFQTTSVFPAALRSAAALLRLPRIYRDRPPLPIDNEYWHLATEPVCAGSEHGSLITSLLLIVPLAWYRHQPACPSAPGARLNLSPTHPRASQPCASQPQNSNGDLCMPADASRQTARPRSCERLISPSRLLPLAALLTLSSGAGAVRKRTDDGARHRYRHRRAPTRRLPRDTHTCWQGGAGSAQHSAGHYHGYQRTDGRTAGGIAAQAMRNVSGISFNAAEGGRSGDNMNLRGYTFGDIYLDGIRDTAQYNRRTFNYEQIDVLRGAGAMLFGRGQAGGVINQVNKTPLQTDRSTKLTGSIGTDGYREVTADLNKRFNADIGLRVNLMNRDEGSWRENLANGDQPETHRQGAAISLALNQDSNNRFWLNHYYLKTRDNLDYGMSFDGVTRRPNERFPSRAYWGTEKTFDNSDTTITTLVNRIPPRPGLDAAHAAASPTTSAATGRRRRTSPAPPSANGVNGGNVTRSYEYETVTLQSDYSTKFKTGSMGHEFLAGMEYLNEDSFRQRAA